MLKTVNFTKRYVLALAIIALLSILAYYNLNHLISSQSNDGKTIDTSSRQGDFFPSKSHFMPSIIKQIIYKIALRKWKTHTIF